MKFSSLPSTNRHSFINFECNYQPREPSATPRETLALNTTASWLWNCAHQTSPLCEQSIIPPVPIAHPRATMQAAVPMTETLSGPSRRPTSLEDCQEKHQKKVRFDSTAIDNEYKMRSRQRKTHLIATATSFQNFVIFPSSPSSANGAAANTSKRINSPSVRSLPAGSRFHETKGSVLGADVWCSVQLQEDFYPQSQNPLSVPLPRTEPRQPITMNSSTYRTSAKRSAKSPARRHRRSLSHVPPSVPDAPSSWNQKPPPAPRPARLPTPDLMDIDGEMFCACDSNMYGKGYGPVGMRNLAKMDAQCMVVSPQ